MPTSSDLRVLLGNLVIAINRCSHGMVIYLIRGKILAMLLGNLVIAINRCSHGMVIYLIRGKILATIQNTSGVYHNMGHMAIYVICGKILAIILDINDNDISNRSNLLPIKTAISNAGNSSLFRV